MSEALYAERASLYDAIYAWKDYAGEAARLHALLGAEGVPDGGRVVEAACGTGKHLAELRPWYRVAGYDRSAAMLALARERLGDVPLVEQDMREPFPGEPADALLCLFSSIGYLHGEEALTAALRAFAASLRPGGALVIEPWLAREDYRDGLTYMQTAETPELKLCRMSSSRLDGELADIEFAWLVGRPGQPVEHFRERHALWLCPRDVFAGALDAAGFDARFEPDGLMKQRGLWIGRKR